MYCWWLVELHVCGLLPEMSGNWWRFWGNSAHFENTKRLVRGTVPSIRGFIWGHLDLHDVILCYYWWENLWIHLALYGKILHCCCWGAVLSVRETLCKGNSIHMNRMKNVEKFQAILRMTDNSNWCFIMVVCEKLYLWAYTKKPKYLPNKFCYTITYYIKGIQMMF